MSIGTVLIIIIVLILLGGLGGPYVNSGWQPGYGLGWYGNGGIMVVLAIIVFLVVLGRV